jgi:hypothetical protein
MTNENITVNKTAGLLPTPPLPDQIPPVKLSDNARQVLIRRYVRRGPDGEPAETVEEMFWRIAYHVAKVEAEWKEDIESRAIEYFELLTSKKFFPNSPTFTGAGTPLGQLAACFVLPISDDMGKDSAGIFQTLRDAALIQQTGGGNGFSFSRLRPKGSLVKSSAGQATGPVGFLRVYDHAFGEIAQGGTRRGANMAVLRVDHPDVEDFVTCKTNENQITNFNISVGITDDFMKAVEEDADWDLVFPEVASPDYKKYNGSIEEARKSGQNFSKRSCARHTTTVNRECSSWMPPTAPTLCRTCTRWKPPIPAASSGWDPTKTAAWAPSTWLSTADQMAAWIGRLSGKALLLPRLSWMILSKPMPMYPRYPNCQRLPIMPAASALESWGWAI